MTPRHIVLAVAAVAVLGLGVYLYVAVNSTTNAVANVRPRAPEAKASPQEHEPADNAPPTKTPTRVAENPPPPTKVNKAVRDPAAPFTASIDDPVQRPKATIDIQKDELMATANKAYDHGDFDEAMVIAKKVLADDPANTRMLRILVSSSCILDDAQTAQTNYLKLPIGGADRADMKKRCERYGVTFSES